MVFDLGMPDRIALITGASRGIGLAIAHRLSADGYHVVVTARSADKIADLADQLNAAGRPADAVACDLGDRSSVDDLVAEVRARHGRLDVLVNNAGALPAARVAEEVTRAEWDAVLEVNLSAPWFLACRAKELMGDRGGVIVNVASTASFYPSRGLIAYNVSKAGVVMLTKVLALEWARHGVRVVGIAPGKIDTDLVAPVIAHAEKKGVALNPQRRVGTGEEVAGLVSYVVSDAAAFVTGSVIPIDGGELLVATSEHGK